jgi:hypothetical protein
LSRLAGGRARALSLSSLLVRARSFSLPYVQMSSLSHTCARALSLARSLSQNARNSQNNYQIFIYY